MLVLNTAVADIKFADIVALCEQGIIEGIQLDYKKILPKDLGKHFAAMSNTRGGLIVLGVEEDDKTGKPIKWEGLPYDAKIIDRVHQFAANVDPIPSYAVESTDADSSGNVFVLVRIFEGDRTPYYVQNDANLWVRTGNVSSRINIASPKEVELLLGKSENARTARENSLKICKDIHEAAVKRSTEKRLRVVKRSENSLASVFANKTRGAQCDIIIQPFYPHRSFASPRDLFSELQKLSVDDPFFEPFPAYGAEPVPNGALVFKADSQSGQYCSQQLHVNGVLYESRDIVKPWSHLEVADNPDVERVTIYENQLAARLWTIFRSAQKFYKYLGYNGSLLGAMTLKGVQGLQISHVTPSGNPNLGVTPTVLLTEYCWEFQLDTAQLGDDASLKKVFVELAQEISWGLGNKSDNLEALNALADR